MMPNRDQQDKNTANNGILRRMVLELISLAWLFIGALTRFLLVICCIVIFFWLFDIWVNSGSEARLKERDATRELNQNAARAVDSLLAYSLRGPGRLASVGPVSFANCKSENTATPRSPDKEVSYSIDWSKVDWDSLTFGNFSGIEGSNVQSWRMYCSGNCEFIGSDELIVGADDINSSLVKSFRNGSFDQQVNTSMIKNHIQQIKLACSSN